MNILDNNNYTTLYILGNILSLFMLRRNVLPINWALWRHFVTLAGISEFQRQSTQVVQVMLLIEKYFITTT